MTLQQHYQQVVGAYVKAFQKAHGIEWEFWVADDIGGTALFGDRYFNFDDIRIAVDNGISSEMLFDWYDENVEHGIEKMINLPAWIKGLRHDQLTQSTAP